MWKSVLDLWNYQEILSELGPTLIIEFGTNNGGSALFFSTVMAAIRSDFRVLTVDIAPGRIHRRVRRDPSIEILGCSSTDPEVRDAILRLRSEFPGPVFAILDSDHAKDHVLRELELVTPLLSSGDYLVVEDTNINGHPLLPDWGPGPFEALSEFEQSHPDLYEHDRAREGKFGFTFAPNGYLIRR